VTTSRGLIITLNAGMFDANGAQLRPAGVVAAQKLAAYLNAYPERGVAVEGYTDGSGNPYVDRQLSEDRARADGERLARRLDLERLAEALERRQVSDDVVVDAKPAHEAPRRPGAKARHPGLCSWVALRASSPR